MANLKDLLAKATVPPTQKLIKRSASWDGLDADGNLETYDCDFFIVDQISFAATDRIYLGDRSENGGTPSQRSIVERIRVGENGEDQLTLEQVQNMPPEMGWALLRAINALDKEKTDAIEAAKKRLSQETNSGTNSYSTESAEGQ